MNVNVFHAFGYLAIWLWKGFGTVMKIFLKDFVRILCEKCVLQYPNYCCHVTLENAYFCWGYEVKAK